MSVLACDRTGCENIMCDRFSSDHGYLCNSCFDELIALGANTNIEEFMGTISTVTKFDYADSLSKWSREFKS